MFSFSKSKKIFDDVLPSFKYEEIDENVEIGEGTYARVEKGIFKGQSVVAKIFKSYSSVECKKLFAKEVTLLTEQHHPNIVKPLGVCETPASIMLELCQFSFAVFNIEHYAYNLEQFLEFLDFQEEYENFMPKIGYKISRDVADAITYLHQNDMVHRDIKPSNVLVSNMHYDKDSDTADILSKPIICKLGDLGLARSSLLRTNNMTQNNKFNRTNFLDRGSGAFMAPEIMVDEIMLQSGDLNDLKIIDVWAMLMTFFVILNPDQKHAYKLDMGGREDEVLLKAYLKEQKPPSFSSKYEQLHGLQYQMLRHLFLKNLVFDPKHRTCANDLFNKINKEMDANRHYLPLKISQATALELFDCKFAKSGKTSMTSTPENDGTNACAFLAVGIVDQLTDLDHNISEEDLPQILDKIISKFPAQFNSHRDASIMYDTSEAYSILRQNNLLQHTMEFNEDILNKHPMFSANCADHLFNELESLASKAREVNKAQFGIFHGDKYIFAVRASTEGVFSALDTHPVLDNCFGNGNGLVVVATSAFKLIEWLILRLVKSGVSFETCRPCIIPVAVCPLSTNLVTLSDPPPVNSFITVCPINIDEEHTNEGLNTFLPFPPADNSPRAHIIDRDGENTHEVIVIEDEGNSVNDIIVEEPHAIGVEADAPVHFNVTEDFYHSDFSLPVYERGCNKPCSTAEVTKIIVHKLFPIEKVAKNVPVYVTDNVKFIVDTSVLADWRSIKEDMVRGMKKIKTKAHYFRVEGGHFKKGAKENYDYLVNRFIYRNAQHNDFHKVIITVCNRDGCMSKYVFVQYYFEGLARNVIEDDNRKQITSVSTIKRIKDLVKEGGKGKSTFHQVSQAVGSFETARTINDIPSSYKQIRDLSRISKKLNMDELVELVDMCKAQLGTENAFLREVRTAPEKSVLLANDIQLNDIHRFCAYNHPWSVLGIDPTFNITAYNVTVTTYHHPLLYDINTGKSPVMIGPVLVHSHKTYDSYYTLASTIIKLKPPLKNIIAIGTDDEPNVYNAVKAQASVKGHLLCFLHMKEDIKNKCKALSIPSEDYITEIFGMKLGDKKVMGLVDTRTSEEFEREYKRLTSLWLKRGKGAPEFVSYMDTYKKSKMNEHMRSDIRTVCGLGNPPEDFTTNSNESINSLLKREKSSGILSLKKTIQLIQEVVQTQQEKVKLAMIRKGDWQIKEKYKWAHEIKGQDFYNMKSGQRITKLKAFNEYKIPLEVEVVTPAIDTPDTPSENIVIPNVPQSIVDDIIKLADLIIMGEDNIRKGFDGDYLVRNWSDSKNEGPAAKKKNQVFKVTSNSTSSFCCEREICYHFRNFKLCAHTLAVAKKTKLTDDFIKIVSKKCRKGINLSQLCDEGKEGKAGRKLNEKKKRRGPANRNNSTPIREMVTPVGSGQVTTSPMPCLQPISTNTAVISNVLPKNDYSPIRQFVLKFVTEPSRIRKCFGCGKKIVNPPNTEIEMLAVCICDIRSYREKVTGKIVQSDVPQNIHFHPIVQCISLKYPSFNPKTVQIPSNFMPHLTAVQKDYLIEHFSLSFN